MSLIAVIMKAPSSAIRFQNASTLLDYGFSNFEYKNLVCKDDIISSVKVDKGVYSTVDAISEKTCGTLISKGSDVNIEQEIFINNIISAPIYKNQIIGKLTYTLNGNVICECNLLSSDDIYKMGFFSMDKLVLGNWINLLR